MLSANSPRQEIAMKYTAMHGRESCGIQRHATAGGLTTGDCKLFTVFPTAWGSACASRTPRPHRRFTVSWACGPLKGKRQVTLHNHPHRSAASDCPTPTKEPSCFSYKTRYISEYIFFFCSRVVLYSSWLPHWFHSRKIKKPTKLNWGLDLKADSWPN